MPIIQPMDVADCRKFIKQHREEIMEGIYDIQFGFDQTLSTTDLLFLAQHCESARKLLAEDQRTPANILEALAKYESVRKSVARNPSTPAATLATLAKDADGVVRESVAGNPSTPAATLAALAKDEDYTVRRLVAGNPSTRKNTIKKLTWDTEESVRTKAKMVDTGTANMGIWGLLVLFAAVMYYYRSC